jgi:hypothetical protein
MLAQEDASNIKHATTQPTNNLSVPGRNFVSPSTIAGRKRRTMVTPYTAAESILTMAGTEMNSP